MGGWRIGPVLFPKCALTGNRIIDMDEPRTETQPIPVQRAAMIERACQEGEVHAVVGPLEEEDNREGTERGAHRARSHPGLQRRHPSRMDPV